MTTIQKNNMFGDLTEICSRHLDECLERALRFADAQLFDKLQHIPDNEQTEIGLAINLLESNSSWIVSNIESAAVGGLFSWQEDSLPNQDGEEDKLGLSLVEKDDFEDWLLVDVSKKKLERELGSSLSDICVVFGELCEASDIGEENIRKRFSLSPERLMISLKESIDKLEIPSVSQITIYRSFATSLGQDLHRLYEELLARIRREGYDPEQIRSKIINKERSEETADVFRSGLNDQVDADYQPDERNEAITEDWSEFGSNIGTVDPYAKHASGETEHLKRFFGQDYKETAETRYQTLNTLARLGTSLQSGHRLGQNEDEGDTDSQDYLSPSDPSPLLGQLLGTEEYAFKSIETDAQSLRDWLSGEIEDGNVQLSQISSSDSELIDVTDNLFSAIAHENTGNATLEKWLGKLKVVILKSILGDRSFFSDGEQPARIMLNKLGSLAELVESGQTRLESLLDRSIDKVVSEYDQDFGSLDSTVAELNSIFERHRAAFERNSERLAKTYDGKQKVANIRHQVVIDLTKLIGNRLFPTVLLELLDDGGWREYMALCAVRDGIDAESYRDALNVIAQLSDWLHAQNSEDESVHADGVIEIGMEAPGVIELVVRELEALGKSNVHAHIERLNDCLMGNAAIEFVSMPRYEWPFSETEHDLRDLLPKDLDSQSQTRWHRQLLSMNVGDWIQITDLDGEARVLRLAWSGEESFRFVFVDNQGMKDEDMSIDELAEGLQFGLVRLIEKNDVPIVDQGLHRLVQSVYEELSGQANCDALTGLLTRQALERAIDQATMVASNQKSSASLIYADINNFNVTNSTFGLSAGDDVLKYVASCLTKAGGTDSYCGRLGGNEFGLVVPNCDQNRAKEIAAKLSKDLSDSPPMFKGNSVHTELRMGVTEIDHEIDDYDSVLRKAEYACRQAKSEPDTRIVVYELKEDQQHRRSEMLHWVSKLDGPLETFLTLRAQEIRPVSNYPNVQSHWEILLGVKHEGQVVPPGQLIEAAENFGKMTVIDRWVVSSAITWMKEHQAFIDRGAACSINLSGQSLSDNHFLDYVEQLISDSGIKAGTICFEITETSAIVNITRAIEFIRVLKKKGCKFSLDDFGSGLSSYAYIQKLPVDYIKIDGMFIRNIVHSENDQALVRSINELAHFMGIQTVAEYVENQEILGVLKEIGVDHSQGYGIRKPILLSDLA